MPVFLKDDIAVLFIHIPKTGGSSMEKQVAEAGWREVFSIRRIPAHKLGFIKASPQHFHAAFLEQMFNLEAFAEIFTIVRDPFARFRSEYYWHATSTKTTPDPNRWIDEIFAAVATNPMVQDNHIRPQVDFLPSETPVHIFKLEEAGVARAMAEIFGKYGDLNAPAPSLSKTLRQRLLPRKAGVQEKVSVRRPEVDAVFEARRAEITAFYAADYARFGYDPAVTPERAPTAAAPAT